MEMWRSMSSLHCNVIIQPFVCGTHQKIPLTCFLSGNMMQEKTDTVESSTDEWTYVPLSLVWTFIQFKESKSTTAKYMCICMLRKLGSSTEDRLGTVSMTQNTSSCGALISSNKHVSSIFPRYYITHKLHSYTSEFTDLMLLSQD